MEVVSADLFSGQNTSVHTSSPIYRPLSSASREIRVLNLSPSIDFDSTIVCCLVHIQLGNGSIEEYEALSYVWGEPEYDRNIILDGKPYAITKNLELALRYLRLSTSERTLWVDALCINQNDVAERSQQVELMKEIYSRCVVDLAWMPTYKSALPTMDSRRCAIGGTISKSRRTQIDDMGDAMHLMRKVCLQDQETLSKLHQRYVSCPSIEAFEWKWKNLTHSDPNNKPANVPFLFEKKEMAVLEQLFLEPPLWNRVWIIQELALSPRVVLAAGHHVLDWELISNFLGDFSFSDAFHVPYRYGFIGKFLDKLFGGPQKVEHQRQSLRAAVQHGGSASTFLDVLMRFEANRASDPRDYVYGLLGLIEDDISIQVDYTKTAARVFTDATLSIINSMRNLDIICQTTWMSRSDAAETRSEPRQSVGLAGLPSWVPDLSSVLVYDKHESMLFAQRGIFSPAEPSPETFVVINGSLLELKAIWIGSFPRKVSKRKSDIMSKRFYLRNSQEKDGVNALWTSQLRQWLAEGGLDLASLDNDAVYVQTTEPVRRALWRTLTMDCTAYPITRVTDEQMPTMDHVFDHILRGQEPEGQSSRASDGGMDFWRMLPSPNQEMFLRNSKFWTFTATDSGLYTMVQGVQEGDILAIVKGAKVPLILRPMGQLGTREVYHFIGTSYVHGFMDGKASEMLEDGLLIETEILLN